MRCFALRGNPLLGNREYWPAGVLVDNDANRLAISDAGGPVYPGGRMDLAMAMGLALIGTFAASTVLFFYKIAP